MTDNSRRHDRETFFKYMSAETARKVLLNGQLRWSSPVLFNDPFDVPREIAHGFTSADISRATNDLVNHYLDNPPEDLSEFDDILQQLFTLARSGFPPDLREEMRRAALESIDHAQAERDLQALRDHWRAVVPTMRILCLAESPGHVAMWNHYADRYRGIVLGFRCNDVTDNFLLVAEPIEYLEAKPEIYTDHGLAKLLCLNSMSAAKATRRLATQTKSDDWSYEKEWRIVDYADESDVTEFWDRPFAKEDLSHIYLGPLVADHDRDHILNLATKYPNVRVFDTHIGMDRELHFQAHEG